MAGEERYPPDLLPRPDPTLLTATAVTQAKEDLRREMLAMREVLTARMDAMDAERKLLLQLMNERKEEIEKRFRERDERFSERDQARQDAVTTALTAVKELSDARDAAADKAIAKFEVSVREQISQIGELAESGRLRLDSQITALKERIDRGEGVGTGDASRRAEYRLNMNQVVSVIAVLAAVVSLLLYALKKLANPTPPAAHRWWLATRSLGTPATTGRPY